MTDRADPVTIDWEAFTDCILCTNWSRPVDMAREFGFGQSTVMAIFHGKPVGLVPFLRVCRAMNIPATDFLSDEPARSHPTPTRKDLG